MSTKVKEESAKTVFVIRGLPGSGKTYLASLIAKEFSSSSGNSVRICSVDHYFLQEDGSYKFDKRLVGRSHAECLSSFLDALNKAYDNVILDNTNSQRWEYLNYETIAKVFGYQVKVLEIECHSQSVATLFHQRNTHSVPASAHLNMYQRWEPDSRTISIRPWFPEHVSLTSQPASRRGTSSHGSSYGHKFNQGRAQYRGPSSLQSQKATRYQGLPQHHTHAATMSSSSSSMMGTESDWPSYPHSH